MNGATLRALRARQLPATAGLVIWVSGMVMLPFLHNLNHRPDHTHPDSAHSHSHSGGHSHPHAHEHPHEQASSSSSEHEREPLDPEHGEGSLLHFAAVVVGAKPAVLPRVLYSVLPASSVRLYQVDAPIRLAFLARGPPGC